MSEIKIANSDEEIMHCFPVMHELRPHLKADEFVAQIRRMMKESFMLAYIDEGAKAVCAAGFRFEEMLFRGKSIYVDDLVTLPKHRSKNTEAKCLTGLLLSQRKKDANRFTSIREFSVLMHTGFTSIKDLILQVITLYTTFDQTASLCTIATLIFRNNSC